MKNFFKISLSKFPHLKIFPKNFVAPIFQMRNKCNLSKINLEGRIKGDKNNQILMKRFYSTKKKLSPAMNQYYQLKEKYPNFLLLFQLGDFYEMFDDDAIKVKSLFIFSSFHLFI